MVGYDDLMTVMEKDKVVVEQGDFVCFRTGFDQVLLEFGASRTSPYTTFAWCSTGATPAAAMGHRFSAVALISDNYAVEGVPSRVR